MEQLDLPNIKAISVLRKILKLVEKYNKHLKIPKRVEVVFDNCCREDRIFYENQIMSGDRNGSVAAGYE